MAKVPSSVIDKQRARIVDAFLTLLAGRPWGEIGLPDIAAEAGLSLAQLRNAYDGKLAILADFARRIDAAVLAGEDEGLADEPARDRLFDVIMRRLDALAPHKDALRGLARSARRDPVLAAAVAPIGLNSQRWMLAAARIPHSGWGVLFGAPALGRAYGRALRVWLDEDDPGLPRTMVALDRELTRLFDLVRTVRRLRGFVARTTGFGRERRRREPEAAPDAPLGAAD